MTRTVSSATGLVMFLAGAGTAHFVIPKFFDAIIPSSLPGAPRVWTYGSGVAEYAVAAAVANPQTRRAGALAAAALSVAVFPANIKYAKDSTGDAPARGVRPPPAPGPTHRLGPERRPAGRPDGVTGSAC